MNSNVYEQVRKSVIGALSGETGLSEEYIREEVAYAASRKNLSSADQERIIEELMANSVVSNQDYKILDGEDQQQRTWLYGRKNSIEWRFWRRYRDFLEQVVELPTDTINKMDNLTDDVLDRLTNPAQPNRWDRRGMVVGHVQSGKTGNYTGLICKAADAGYRVFIVLTGLHSSLRSQTQHRLDEGFIGRDTQTERAWIKGNESSVIGAGRFSSEISATAFTSSAEDGDFSSKSARSLGVNVINQEHTLIVVKKNVKVLNALLRWLGAQGQPLSENKKIIRRLPLLLIDDEADNASINVSKTTASAINRNIRALLSLFEQKAYVGYTATPYANVYIPDLAPADYEGQQHKVNGAEFIVGQDLFPRDFIVNLPAPSNYIGATRIFGLGAPLNEDQTDAAAAKLLPIVRRVDDYRLYIPDRHKMRDKPPTSLPPSLERAMKCFILTCAIRRVRGQQNRHSSMLIHVSRFVLWQDAIAELVDEVLKDMKRELRYNNGSLLSELKALFEADYEPTTEQVVEILHNDPHWSDPAVKPCTWEHVLPALLPAAEKIVVRVAHGAPDKSGGNPLHRPINYVDYERVDPAGGAEAGLSVIAVGGDKLSRGLTLEGLSVSYFLRASRMYDTLMQMGRWFGYRPGYADLCRLYTTTQLLEWYQHIALASEEMRDQFDEMVQLNSTPSKYGIKIRTLPGMLQITATNKMRGAVKMYLSYSDKLMETYSFKRDAAIVAANYHLTRALIAALGSPGVLPTRTERETTPKQGLSWQTNADVVMDFLKRYKTSQPNIEPNKLIEYIQEKSAHGIISKWTIVLMQPERKEKSDLAPAFPFIIDGKRVLVNSTIRRHEFPREHSKSEGEKRKRVALQPPTEGPYMVSRSHIIDPRHELLDLTDGQVKAACDAHRAAKEKEQQDKRIHALQVGLPEPDLPEVKVDVPAGRFIRTARPQTQGLLLLYPLSPVAAGMGTEYPVMGYALSFPKILDDEGIEYAVNEVFQQEFETDYDEVDPDEEALANG
ncbi:Z1 domain-containing protein [Hymenobacter sp. UYP22]|uniref:Z1 domain-containing protein n=1 Tax=Hymenobacter sp. UYP22 TaxID=3156348 RepID=UPI0033965775